MAESYTPKEISSFLGLIDTYIRYRQEVVNAGKRSYLSYHPSEIGGCLRQQQYRHYVSLGYIDVKPETFQSKILRLFDKGHNMHDRWSNYFRDMGVLRGVWRCKNKACFIFDDDGKLKKMSEKEIKNLLSDGKSRSYGKKEKLGVFCPEKCICGCSDFEYEECLVVSEELNMIGHCDLLLDCSRLNESCFDGVRKTYMEKYLPKNGDVVVADMKTIGSNGWTKLLRSGPSKKYLIQLISYIHILECSYGLLVYENKDNSEIKMFKIDRNEEWWDTIKYQMKTMTEMANTKDENGNKKPKLPPPRYDSKSCYDCKNCEFKSSCHKSSIWDNPNLEDIKSQFYKELL